METSESESYEEYFGDHCREFQYQGEKSESQSFKECFGDHFRVLQYLGETGY